MPIKRRMQTEAEITWTVAIGKWLRQNRLSRGYSQKDFADVILVPTSVLANAESGNKALPLYPFFLATEHFKKK